MKSSEEIIKIIKDELLFMEENSTSFTWGEYHAVARLYSKVTGSEFSNYLTILEDGLSAKYKRCM